MKKLKVKHWLHHSNVIMSNFLASHSNYLLRKYPHREKSDLKEKIDYETATSNFFYPNYLSRKKTIKSNIKVLIIDYETVNDIVKLFTKSPKLFDKEAFKLLKSNLKDNTFLHSKETERNLVFQY